MVSSCQHVQHGFLYTSAGDPTWVLKLVRAASIFQTALSPQNHRMFLKGLEYGSGTAFVYLAQVFFWVWSTESESESKKERKL